MKRWCFGSFIIIFGIFLARVGLTATYDATGTWNATVSGHWNYCDEPNPGTEQYAGVIVQKGNSFTLIILTDESTVTGTVSGATYTTNETYYEDDGWVNETCTITATSNSQASGPCGWTWSGFGESCYGGYNISMTRNPQNAPTYDATGSWDYSTSSHSNTCGDPTENPRAGTVSLTQTQNRVTLVDDQQVQYDGFVSGATYTFVTSYPDDNGTTSEVYTINLGTGGTSGSGSCTWVWNGSYDSCDGGFNISIAKQQGYTITATAWQGGTISPSGAISVDGGSDQSFTITPQSGYTTLGIFVDGALAGTGPTYNLTNVQADQVIEAAFELDGSTCQILSTERFEGGLVPPPGWTVAQINQSETWQVSSNSHTGTYSAEVLYDPQLETQDELLLTPMLPMSAATLRLWSMGSTHWCRDDYDNCDLEVWVIAGSWDAGSGDDVLLGKVDDIWPGNFRWGLTTYDLTPVLPKRPVRIGFRYKGINGAQVVIDNIQICYDRAVFASPWLPLILGD